jgi:hypothetical protein
MTVTDPYQIGFGTARKTKQSHGSTSRCWEFECFANTRKHVALGDATGVTFINRCPQGGKFRLILLLFALQGPQRRAHHFARIFVATALDLLQNETVKFIGKIHIAGWHFALRLE